MAVTMATPEEKSKLFALKFFDKVSPLAHERVKTLYDAGAILTVQFSAFSVSYQGHEFGVHPLQVNSTSVLKGTALPPGMAGGVEKFLGAAIVKLDLFKENGKWPGVAPKGVPVDIKPDTTVDPTVPTAVPPSGAKMSFTPEGKPVVKKPNPFAGLAAEMAPEAPPPVKAPKGAPVPLKDATSLLQPVNGTSAGSVYYVIALGKRAKIAARVKASGAVSVRVEGDINDAEKSVLQSLGFTGGGHYMSNHYSMGSVPPERLVGALLFTKGLNLTSKIEGFDGFPGGN